VLGAGEAARPADLADLPDLPDEEGPPDG